MQKTKLLDWCLQVESKVLLFSVWNVWAQIEGSVRGLVLCPSACDLSPEQLSIPFSFARSSDQCRDSVTSYIKGEGKPETNGSLSESTSEAKTKSYIQEALNDVGKHSDKEALKTKSQISTATDEQTLSSTAYQKSLEETSKPTTEGSKTSVPVSVKKMGWSTSEDGKPRTSIQEEEGAIMSEQKVQYVL